jgi:hypothetical protein
VAPLREVEVEKVGDEIPSRDTPRNRDKVRTGASGSGWGATLSPSRGERGRRARRAAGRGRPGGPGRRRGGAAHVHEGLYVGGDGRVHVIRREEAVEADEGEACRARRCRAPGLPAGRPRPYRPWRRRGPWNVSPSVRNKT